MARHYLPCLLACALLCPTLHAQESRVANFGPALHSITVPHNEPYLPDGPGRAEFLQQCVICHSPRYVVIQPAFTRKTWAAEVAKMRNEYGAPIPDAAVEPILDYLMYLQSKRTP